MPDLNIFGPIGASLSDDDGFGLKDFEAFLADVDPEADLAVNINSPGGSVFEGLSIYQILAQRPGKTEVTVHGVAASIASIIAMAGDRITMGQASHLMIHDPMGPSAIAFGYSDELRQAAQETAKMADLLDSIKQTLVDVYAARTGQAKEVLASMMSAETWLDAAEAAERGFADAVTPNKSVTACIDKPAIACKALTVVEVEDIAALCNGLPMPKSCPLGHGKDTFSVHGTGDDKGAGRLRLAKAKLRMLS